MDRKTLLNLIQLTAELDPRPVMTIDLWIAWKGKQWIHQCEEFVLN